jgi:hypothetical protein
MKAATEKIAIDAVVKSSHFRRAPVERPWLPHGGASIPLHER